MQGEGSSHGGHVGFHSHLWWMGILGVAAGLGLMIFVPRLAAVSRVLVLFAAFHLIGAVVVVSSLYATAGKALRQHLAGRSGAHAAREASRYDFGWDPWMTTAPWLGALVAMAVAVAVQVSAPAWWPVTCVLVLLAANGFAGYVMARAATRPDHAVLPMVDLVSSDSDVVLDGGCGSGRTSLWLGRVLRNGRIVALDRFDARYIDQGGRALLDRNLRRAGLADRVQTVSGDLTSMPFGDCTFDSAVSAHAMDHLGRHKERGLREMLRVLKPGARFLLVVWIPGWAAFAMASVMSFLMTRPEGWRRLAVRAGFEIADQGHFNGFWYLLLRRPHAEAAAS